MPLTRASIVKEHINMHVENHPNSCRSCPSVVKQPGTLAQPGQTVCRVNSEENNIFVHACSLLQSRQALENRGSSLKLRVTSLVPSSQESAFRSQEWLDDLSTQPRKPKPCRTTYTKLVLKFQAMSTYKDPGILIP